MAFIGQNLTKILAPRAYSAVRPPNQWLAKEDALSPFQFSPAL